MADKRISLEEAVAAVQNGQTLGLGGLTLYRRPFALVRALLQRCRQTGEPGNLTLLTFTAGMESDLLVGAGMVRRTRTCYFGLEIFGLAPMFTYHANRGEIEIIEESEASLSFGLRAQMAGTGFMPGRAWLGTDMLKLRPDVRTVIDPYSGEELVAFPPLKADVCLIHALQADHDGNALIGGNQAIDLELALTAKTVIISAEEIVPKLDKADIVAPLVDAVVEAKGGALPSSCHPYYSMDGMSYLSYTETASDPDSFRRFLDGWLAK
jgi:glutaconate CoA-transferase subunit A